MTAISAGTTSRSGLRAGPFEVSEVAFAGGVELPWHAHPRGCVAVVVGGAVEKRFARLRADAEPGTIVTMPAGESHADAFGREGARIVVVETDEPVPRVVAFRDWGAALLGHRIARELAAPDAYTPLALEGLALELAAAAARGPAAPRAEPWLESVRELLHERFREPPSLGEIAAGVGVHPSHLARTFRARYGDSVGGYARRLRVEWAAERLARTDEPLVCLAHEAGFVDQSHFTRAFGAHFGLTPARYRRAHR
jgi:AraC family transcriptional regulator